MVRPLRVEYPGAVYHVMSRGNAKEIIFLEEKDHLLFLSIFKEVIVRFNWKCYAYCLMPNHYHVIIETCDGNLSKGMRHLNGVYTQRLNKKYNRVGHIFQGRYKAILVEKENYLLELCRYIVLNPIRAKLVKSPLDWKWNSCAEIIERKTSIVTDSSFILSQFSNNCDKAIEAFCEFIKDGIGDKVNNKFKESVILGSEKFINLVKSFSKDKRDDKEIKRKDRLIGRLSLDKIFGGVSNREDRDGKIYTAHIEHGYSLTEIGRALNLHYSSVSKIINKKHESKNSQFKT